MTTCPCSAETTNGYLCRVCQGHLRRDLAKIADLWPESEVTLSRQGVGAKSGGKGKAIGNAKSTPLPFDERASETRWVVENTVTTWLRDVTDEQIPPGVHDVPTAALWLSQNVRRLAGLPQAPEAMDDLTDACKQLSRLVDRRTEKQTVPCDICGKALTAEVEDFTATCRDCERVVDIPSVRARKVVEAHEARLDRWKATRVAALVYGVRLTDKTFDRWEDRGELKRGDDGLYAASRVMVLVERIVARRRNIA